MQFPSLPIRELFTSLTFEMIRNYSLAFLMQDKWWQFFPVLTPMQDIFS